VIRPRLAVSALLCAGALVAAAAPAGAQTDPTVPTPQPAPVPAPPPPPPPAPVATATAAPSPPPSQRLFWGGGVGFWFGDVDYIEITPLLGVHVRPRLDVGATLLFRYRNDDRYYESLSTTDYGGSVFARYRLTPRLFAEAAWEYQSIEYVTSYSGATDRGSWNSVLLGGGFTQPISRSGAFYVSAMYILNYDDNDPQQPYSDPVIVRVGVSFGF
jgi:hypothetical protein